MTQRTVVGALVGMLALTGLVGCPFFNVPLDPGPQVEVDKTLLGTWRCLGADPEADDKAASLTIASSKDRFYDLRLQDPDSGEDESFEGYGSSVKGHVIINVRERKASQETQPWMLVRTSFPAPNILRVQMVDDELVGTEVKTSSALRAAVERHDGDPALYTDTLVCVRVRKTSPEDEAP